jgi:hypothetical protein
MADREFTMIVEDVADDDLICSAVLVVSVLEANAERPHIRLCQTEALSAIEQVGMLRIAERIALVEASEVDEE